MGTEKETVSGWLLKYILPIIIIPILSSSIITYGSTIALETQIINDGKRIEQLEVNTNMTRVELSKHNERLTKIEILVERINKSLDDSTKELMKIRSDLGEIGKIVVVLKDRTEREDGG